MKRVLLYLVLILMTAYTMVMAVVLPTMPYRPDCKEIKVRIYSGGEDPLYSSEEISSRLKASPVNPIGISPEMLNTEMIEMLLDEYTAFTSVKAYRTGSGDVKIDLQQRLPICKIMGDYGVFYLDNQGSTFESKAPFVKYLPIASGSVTKEYATKELCPLVLFLDDNDFWKAQIQQINVAPDGDIELIPTIGQHTIILGKADYLEEKFARLEKFYEKGLNVVGWNRYSKLSLKFKNQVVCTKQK